MQNSLVNPTNCASTPTCAGSTVGPPGSSGPSGADGTDGTNGAAAFSNLSSGFTMPYPSISLTCTTVNTDTAVTTADTSNLVAGMAVSGTGIPASTTISSITNSTTFVLSQAATVSGSNTLSFTDYETVSIIDSSWVKAGINVYIEGAGYFNVISVPSLTSIELRNVDANGNTAAGNAVGTGGLVLPSGWEGASTAISSISLSMPGIFSVNGSPLTSSGTFSISLTNQNANQIWAGPTSGAAGAPTFRALVSDDIPNLAASKITSGQLPITYGGTGASTKIAGFDSLSPNTSAGDIVTHNGTNNIRLPLGSALDLIRVNAGGTSAEYFTPKAWERSGILGFATGVDANTTSDTSIAINSSKYIIRKIVVTDASVSLTTLQGGVYTNASKGGTILVAATQAYTSLTAANKFLDLTLASPAQDEYQTATTLYFSPTTAQGASATLSIYIFGEDLS